MKKVLISTITACFLTTSCASMFSKSQWPVNFTSNPESANVKIEDEMDQKIFEGATPTQYTLESSDGFFSPAKYKVTFSKKGHKDDIKLIKAGFNAWTVVSIAFSGVIGLLVDAGTGAMYKIKEETITGNLPKKTAFNYVTQSTIKLSEVPETLRPYLVKVN
jgi:hypothetical protein